MLDHRNPYNLPIVKEQNTIYLVLPYDLENDSHSNAVRKCDDLVAYDYDDWELPTLSVLQLMYNNKGKIGGFTNKCYWSSSSSGTNIYHDKLYYSVYFDSGSTSTNPSSDYAEIRPVRRY